MSTSCYYLFYLHSSAIMHATREVAKSSCRLAMLFQASYYNRKDCGFPGITSGECTERACCFKPTDTPGVPWCYTESFEETTSTVPKTTTYPTTTTVSPTTIKPIPDWIKALMNATTGVNTKSKFVCFIIISCLWF